MNIKRYILASIAAFAFIFVLEYFVHGIILKEVYMQTANIWRPEEEASLWFMLLSQLGFAYVMAFIFTRHYEAKGATEGLRFGLYIGLLLAMIDFGAYAYLPVPFALVISWMAASILKGVGAGITIALIYKN